MKNREKQYDPIRRGAPSLPFDFTEALKEINTKRFLEEHRMEHVCGKKKYRFDDIRYDVMNWSPEVRKNITKQMIYMIPWRVTYWSDLDSGLIILDYFGERISDIDEWKRQREEYIENLYKELTEEND